MIESRSKHARCLDPLFSLTQVERWRFEDIVHMHQLAVMRGCREKEAEESSMHEQLHRINSEENGDKDMPAVSFDIGIVATASYISIRANTFTKSTQIQGNGLYIPKLPNCTLHYEYDLLTRIRRAARAHLHERPRVLSITTPVFGSIQAVQCKYATKPHGKHGAQIMSPFIRCMRSYQRKGVARF